MWSHICLLQPSIQVHCICVEGLVVRSWRHLFLSVSMFGINFLTLHIPLNPENAPPPSISTGSTPPEYTPHPPIPCMSFLGVLTCSPWRRWASASSRNTDTRSLTLIVWDVVFFPDPTLLPITRKKNHKILHINVSLYFMKTNILSTIYMVYRWIGPMH